MIKLDACSECRQTPECTISTAIDDNLVVNISCECRNQDVTFDAHNNKFDYVCSTVEQKWSQLQVTEEQTPIKPVFVNSYRAYTETKEHNKLGDYVVVEDPPTCYYNGKLSQQALYYPDPKPPFYDTEQDALLALATNYHIQIMRRKGHTEYIDGDLLLVIPKDIAYKLNRAGTPRDQAVWLLQKFMYGVHESDREFADEASAAILFDLLYEQLDLYTPNTLSSDTKDD